MKMLGWDTAQLVEYLPSLDEDPSSISSSIQTGYGNASLHPSKGEVKTGGLEVQDHPTLHSKFKVNPEYVRPCLKRKRK